MWKISIYFLARCSGTSMTTTMTQVFLVFLWNLMHKCPSTTALIPPFPHWVPEGTLRSGLKMNASLASFSSLSQFSFPQYVNSSHILLRLESLYWAWVWKNPKEPSWHTHPLRAVLFHWVPTFPVRLFPSHSILITCLFDLIFIALLEV